MLVEFPSVVDAVRYAVEVQRGMVDHCLHARGAQNDLLSITLARRASSAGSDFVGYRNGWVWALFPLPHAATLRVRWRRHLRRGLRWRFRVELKENVLQTANSRRRLVAILGDVAGQKCYESELLLIGEVERHASGWLLGVG
jgi:hypothetical protein